jgi:hypothetical protein
MISISRQHLKVVIIDKYSKDQCNVETIANYMSKIFKNYDKVSIKDQICKVYF